MNTYEVRTSRSGVFYVAADDYSISPDNTRVLFWTGTRITRSFLISELENGVQNSISRVQENPNVEPPR